MAIASQDRNFVFFLTGSAVTLLGASALNSFFPLFMKEQLGLSQGSILRVQTAAMAGGLVSSLPWGWAADRYGGKRIILLSMGAGVLFPLAWLLIPANSASTLYLAAALSFLAAAVGTGAVFGAGRVLYVSVVPRQERTHYLSVYYAGMGLVGGLAPIAGGAILKHSTGLSGRTLLFTTNSYTPLFILTVVLTVAALLFYRKLRSDAPN
jgi:MFS family permease